MTSSPEPWVMMARKAIIWAGFGCVMGCLIFAATSDSGAWMFFGILFMSAVFLLPALALALVLPTYKARMIAVPVFIVFLDWVLVSQSETYDEYNLALTMVLWIVTFTAITLLIPEFSVPAFIGRYLRKD